MRDEFSKDVKETLSLRVCLRCSLCGCQTAGPTAEPDGRVLVGEAAHICGASPRGPRYDRNQTPQERRSIENGIWLCAGHAKQVDDDKSEYTTPELRRIKREAEERARKQLLIPGHAAALSDWKELQISKISSFVAPIRLPTKADRKELDHAEFDKITDHLLHWVAMSFRHACVATPYDDFAFVLSIEHAKRECEKGYTPFDLSLFCHITAFIWAFEEWAQLFLEGKRDWKAGSRLRDLPGDQRLDVRDVEFGKMRPCRISRSGPSSISLRGLAGRPIPTTARLNTSALLRVVSIILKSEIVIWDNADRSPDFEKVMSMVTRVSDTGRFSWDQIRIDRDDPESWEFVADG